jgi:MFS family permease
METAPAAHVRRRAAPGPVTVVGVSLAALAAGTFATVAVGALAPELRADLGLSRTEIGVLTALVFAGAAVASPRAGVLTDRHGPVPVLAAALAGFAAAIGVAAVAPSAPVLMAAMLLGGLAYGGVNPPTNVVIAGRMSSRLGLVMSLKQTGVPAGAFLSGLLLPPIALAVGWRWAFGLAALVALAVAAATSLLRGANVLARMPRAASGTGGPSRREWAAIAGFGFVMAGAQWVFLAYLVLFLTESHGFSLRAAGLSLSLATVASVAARMFWGWLSDRPGRRVPALLAACGLGAGSLALLAAGVGGPAIWVLVVATGAGLVGWNGVFHALVADRAGAGMLGKLSGRMMLYVFGGSVCLPPLLGLASERLDSWTTLWGVAAGLVAAAGVVLSVGAGTGEPS